MDSAAPNGGQGKLTDFVYFPWPPIEAGLSISTFLSYLHVVGGFRFVIYTLFAYPLVSERNYPASGISK